MCAKSAEPFRIVYFGTPDYAVPALEALLANSGIDVALVVTQPDRPAGRGRKLAAPPVKDIALARSVEVYQPESLRTEADREPIARVGADLFVVAAYGKIFGPKLLALPRLGAVNLHASLLPAYRGASPISAAILEGADETGVTLMRMDTGLDSGPILASRSIPIGPTDTTASLTPKLAELGARLLTDSLTSLAVGTLTGAPQNESCVTLTRPMVKSDGWIDWSLSAVEIERQVRAMWEWPRAFTSLRGESVQIHRATADKAVTNSAPGTVEISSGMSVVATGQGGLVIETAQSAGGKPLSGEAWLQQSRSLGEVLGKEGEPAIAPPPLVRRLNG